MSDPLERDGDPLFTAAAEYGRTHLGWTDDEPDTDPVDDLLERAENAHSPELSLAYAQMATARAIQAQTERQHIANLIAYASHRLDHTDATAARNAPALIKVLAAADFQIREGLGLS